MHFAGITIGIIENQLQKREVTLSNDVPAAVDFVHA